MKHITTRQFSVLAGCGKIYQFMLDIYRRDWRNAAALSELYRRTKALGVTHMTGGDNEFYKAIGYKPAVKWTRWKKR